VFENSRLGKRCGCGGVGDIQLARGFLVVFNCVLESMMDFRYWDLRLKSGTSARVQVKILLGNWNLSDWYINYTDSETISRIWRRFPIVGFNSKSPIPEIHHGIPERS